MNNDDGIILQMQEDGAWGIKEEPYYTIELQTKEDYEKLEEMLEKQKPRKPIARNYNESFIGEGIDKGVEYFCLNCNSIVGAYSRDCEDWIGQDNWCSGCGQKLDWSVEE